MVTLIFVLGVIGNTISVLLFLSPIKTFWRIVKRRSTEEFESLPYICTLLSSGLWTYYGLTKPGSLFVATTNGFGVLLESIYVILFIIFAPRKMRAKTAILALVLDVGFVGAAILTTRTTMEKEVGIQVIGFVCAGLNIIMYGSPLAAMKRVVATRSVEYMPFLLSFVILLNGGVWTVYAVLVRDVFLAVPNGAGFILGIAQLALYALYHNTNQCQHNQNQPLLQASTLV